MKNDTQNQTSSNGDGRSKNGKNSNESQEKYNIHLQAAIKLECYEAVSMVAIQETVIEIISATNMRMSTMLMLILTHTESWDDQYL